MHTRFYRLAGLLCTTALLSSCALFYHVEHQKFLLYPVKAGDTIDQIARRFEVPQEQLLKINQLTDPRALPLGKILRIPYQGQNRQMTEADARAADLLKVELSKPRTKPQAASLKTIRLTTAQSHVGNLHWPADGEIVSHFGTRWFSFHEGIDIAAPERTIIRAAQNGVVVYSGNGLRGYGNLVIIQAADLITVYGHNRKNRIQKGAVVKRGDIIAEVGQSGKATGPHLHFETRIKNKDGRYQAVDPLVFFPGERKR